MARVLHTEASPVVETHSGDDISKAIQNWWAVLGAIITGAGAIIGGVTIGLLRAYKWFKSEFVPVQRELSIPGMNETTKQLVDDTKSKLESHIGQYQADRRVDRMKMNSRHRTNRTRLESIVTRMTALEDEMKFVRTEQALMHSELGDIRTLIEMLLSERKAIE
jgi:hypothetical protein